MQHFFSCRHTIVATLVFSLFCGVPAIGGPKDDLDWRISYTVAYQEAIAAERLILVQIGAPWCRPCRQMKSGTYRDSALADTISCGFVPLYIDGDANPGLARQFRADVYPTTLVVTTDLKIVRRWSGYRSATELKFLLDSCRSTYRTGRAVELLVQVGDTPASALEPSNLGQEPAEVSSQGMVRLGSRMVEVWE